jgi:transcriptional regulator with XRE-family HTH domain/VIT1/CCC1 family predicted Fe2+/Mn2+ transporter
MSFRDNLQHLRATRNMTQEQLAMFLGVSRQSVSKWEAERAYPEMDKLLKLCDLFGCTLDELVTGDLSSRPTDAASRMTRAKAPQDVTGYDQMTRAFAWKTALGASMPISGLALSVLLPNLVLIQGIDFWNYSGVMLFIGIAVGLALILPALFERGGFRKAHPFVEDFYTADQKTQARKTISTGLVTGIGLILAGFVVMVLMQSVALLAASAFLALVAIGVFFIVYGCLRGLRCNVEAYNRKSLSGLEESEIDALDDETLQARARRAKHDYGVYKIVVSLTTAVALILLFVPAFNAERWFWLAWVVGGVLCITVGAYRSLRRGK